MHTCTPNFTLISFRERIAQNLFRSPPLGWPQKLDVADSTHRTGMGLAGNAAIGGGGTARAAARRCDREGFCDQ